jgi:hypothetical protein
METELVYVPLEDAKLERLALASEASGRSIDELVSEALNVFLEARQRRWNQS